MKIENSHFTIGIRFDNFSNNGIICDTGILLSILTLYKIYFMDYYIIKNITVVNLTSFISVLFLIIIDIEEPFELSDLCSNYENNECEQR